MTGKDPEGALESAQWSEYFRDNCLAPHELPWEDLYSLTSGERSTLETSIQQFQLGEGSDGKRLLKRGEEFARRARDPEFTAALLLFIQEEQRHSTHLGRFMEQQGIPTLRQHWVDSVFRRLRGLAGLELSLSVLVTAELIAVPYYRALHDATESPLLCAICRRILADEAAHLRFQASLLARLASGRPPVWQMCLASLHALFLLGTCVVVWFGHERVFAAANCAFGQFLEETLIGFFKLQLSRRRTGKRLAAQAAEAPAPSALA